MSRFSLFASSAAFAASGVVAMIACSEDPVAPDTRTLTGPVIAVGAGTAWTELQLDRSDQIKSIALVFTETALSNLPATLPNTEFIVPLPADAPAMVFNHVAINWQPEGHPPPMVYTVPHFDVHYYLVTTQQRDAMTPADAQFGAKSAAAPPAAQAVPGYVGDPFGIPRMGAHWTDRNSHEFHGSAFTSTMVYGFYEGKMIFLEPMLTKAFLESKPNVTKNISVPASYPKVGRYPTAYRVAHDPATRQYRVELMGFEARQ